MSFDCHYIDWQKKRIDVIVDHYGSRFFQDKRVLELGCGYADIGAHFHSLGAQVVCIDARPEHVEVARQRHPFLTVIQHDLEKVWTLGSFDVILHLGVLYHLSNIESNLRDVCGHCNHLVLESVVCDSSNPDLCLSVTEEGYDQSYSGLGSRPAPAYVERIIYNAGMLCNRLKGPECNSSIHQYDWMERNTEEVVFGYRRFWFCRRRLLR